MLKQRQPLLRQDPAKSLFLNSVKPTVQIVAGGKYWIGASTSPSLAIVTRIEGQTLWYVCYPYYQERREQVSIFRLLASSGCEMQLRNMERPDSAWLCGKPAWAYEQEAYLRRLIAGEAPEPVDYRDYQRVYLYFTFDESVPFNEAWDILSDALGYSVSGQHNRTLELSSSRGEAPATIAKCPAGFTFVKMTDEANLGGSDE